MSEKNLTGEPVVSYTKIDESGAPYLLGSHCRVCGAMHLGHFDNCPKCGSIGQLDDVKLAGHGQLYNYTIVYRSLPGVKVPFISAIVDLDGGGTVRGNLLEIDPDPSKIAFGMPVQLVFRSAADAVQDGEGYFSHFFVPSGKEAAQ